MEALAKFAMALGGKHYEVDNKWLDPKCIQVRSESPTPAQHEHTHNDHPPVLFQDLIWFCDTFNGKYIPLILYKNLYEIKLKYGSLDQVPSVI